MSRRSSRQGGFSENICPETARRELGTVATAVADAAARRDAPRGEVLTFAQYGPFFEKNSRARRWGRDLFGNSYGDQVVGEAPAVPRPTYEKLRVVVPDGFWEPYPVRGPAAGRGKTKPGEESWQ